MNRKDRKRVRAIERRLIELLKLAEHGPEVLAEAAALRDELMVLEGAQRPAQPVPPKALPAAPRTPREPSEAERWRQVVSMRRGRLGPPIDAFDRRGEEPASVRVNEGRTYARRQSPWR